MDVFSKIQYKLREDFTMKRTYYAYIFPLFVNITPTLMDSVPNHEEKLYLWLNAATYWDK